MRISDWSSDVCSSDLTWFKRMLAIAYDAKRMDLAVPASLDLVSAYPSADNWRDSLIIFRDTGKLDDQATLDLMRLIDRKSVVWGKSVSGSVDLGGRRLINTKNIHFG